MKLYFQFHEQVFEGIPNHFWCNFILVFEMPWGMIGAKVYECNYTLFLLLPNKIYRRYNQPFTLNDAFNSVMEALKRPLLALAQNEPWKKKPLLIFVYEELIVSKSNWHCNLSKNILEIYLRYLHKMSVQYFLLDSSFIIRL